MTAQPTRDQLLDMTEDLGLLGDRPELCDQVVDGLWAALAQAEHRIARLEAQTDIRGRAVIMYRERAREAEAWAEYQNEEVDLLEASLDRAEAERDQAYEWADGQSYPLVMRQGEILTGVANALNGPTPPLTSWSHHDLAKKAAAMVARAEQAEAQIKAVEDVHRHITVETRGATEPEHRCLDCCLAWPCPTIRALEGEMA